MRRDAIPGANLLHLAFPLRGKPGAPPGTIDVEPGAPPPRIRAMGWSEEALEEATLEAPEAIDAWRERWPLCWINVNGLGDADVLQRIADRFGLHPLELEDVVHTDQRPKMEMHAGHVFVVLRMVRLVDGHIASEQVSLFFGKGFVLTFQERAGDCLDPVRARARQSRGYMRARGADYLAYAVLDAIVDNYFPVLEHIGDELDDLEDQVLVDPSEDLVRGIHRARRALLAMRRAVWPLREALSSLVREHIELIDEGTRVFLRDCYDHAVQVIDLIENYREISAGLMDVYLSSVSNRLNEVMRVLTVISTVFIVPTFLVGVYGMNFRYMPELRMKWAYPAVWAIMLLSIALMLRYFRKRGWLGSLRTKPKGEKR